MKYLGHVISAAGVATYPEKISAIKEWKTQLTLTELLSFLGNESYYSLWKMFYNDATPSTSWWQSCSPPGRDPEQDHMVPLGTIGIGVTIRHLLP